jgi:ribosome-interacting GTPase 1
VPANLSPEYLKAERDYRAAAAPEEKLACLEQMLSVIPKHKGTDKMQADLKQRIARLRGAIEKQTKKKGPSLRVRPEGAGQITLAGPPNSGKSSLLAALTHARPEIADYPCTTREPLPGMVNYEGVPIQLVDLPPVWREHCESFVFDNIRASQGVLLVVDLSAPDPLRDFAETRSLLAEKKILLGSSAETEAAREAQPAGRALEFRLVVNKVDLDPQGELLALVQPLLDSGIRWHAVSARCGTGLAALRAALFDMLHVIRIYSKEPGKPPDRSAPFTIPADSTVLDFAACVHKEIAAGLKSARVWGSAKFDGQAVHRDHVLQDQDVVELIT